eukprot:Skav211626  [mRNA]  locus=scaffold1088:151939:152514:+ [translate_table: standard]
MVQWYEAQQRDHCARAPGSAVMPHLLPQGQPLVAPRLSAEKDSEVTFDEVVTARKERSQQYKRKQLLGAGLRGDGLWLVQVAG